MSVNEFSGNIVDAPVSGMMGLAFKALADTGATPFWQTVFNILSNQEMSFWLARESTSETSSSFGGVFTLGGTNSSLFSGDIEFLNLTSPGSANKYWLLSLSSE